MCECARRVGKVCECEEVRRCVSVRGGWGRCVSVRR